MSQEQPRYNPYIDNGQDIQCCTTQPHRTENWEHRKNQNGFRRNGSKTSQILTILRILEGARAKNLQATVLFVDFAKAFASIYRGKMQEVLLAYDQRKHTVTAMMMLYKNTKVRSSDGDTDYFDIVAGVLHGDKLTLYVFIIYLD